MATRVRPVPRVSLRDKTPPAANAKRAGEPVQAAKQTADQPAPQAPPDKTAVPADTEAPPQAAAQADTQRPVPGGSYDFHTDQWATLYAKRIDEMIAALKSKDVPIVWVGLPVIRGTKATSDMSYLDELYRERAEKAGIIYVDIWDGFVDDQERYAVQGPDFEGQVRRLRTADGVHFTKAGAVKLASYVDRELRRVMSTHVAPVALPAPESAPKSGAAGARPDVGPVLPLSSGDGEHGDLLGAADHPSQTNDRPECAICRRRRDQSRHFQRDCGRNRQWRRARFPNGRELPCAARRWQTQLIERKGERHQPGRRKAAGRHHLDRRALTLKSVTRTELCAR